MWDLFFIKIGGLIFLVGFFLGEDKFVLVGY